MARELFFKLRIDATDKRRLDKLAKERCAPASTVIRQLVKAAVDELDDKRRGRRASKS